MTTRKIIGLSIAVLLTAAAATCAIAARTKEQEQNSPAASVSILEFQPESAEKKAWKQQERARIKAYREKCLKDAKVQAFVCEAPDWPAYVEREVTGPISVIKRLLRLALEQNLLVVSDFEKLDFSLPGEPGYGEDPVYDVFNPNGSIPYPRKKDGSLAFVPSERFSQDALDRAVVSERGRIVYNIFRTRSVITNIRGQYTPGVSEYVLDGLYAVVPDVDPEIFCSEKYAKRKHAPAGWSLAPDNREPIASPTETLGVGCVYGPDGRAYYLGQIALRIKAEGTDKWQTY